ncbi:hypothetical protein ACFX1Z_037655 [Malus domestica]
MMGMKIVSRQGPIGFIGLRLAARSSPMRGNWPRAEGKKPNSSSAGVLGLDHYKSKPSLKAVLWVLQGNLSRGWVLIFVP